LKKRQAELKSIQEEYNSLRRQRNEFRRSANTFRPDVRWHAIALAVASGITPGNVAEHLEVVDCFLVATGISTSFEELCPKLTRDLAKAVHEG